MIAAPNALDTIKRDGIWKLDDLFNPARCHQDTGEKRNDPIEAELKAVLTVVTGSRKRTAEYLGINEELVKKTTEKVQSEMLRL